jgi:hypothetical protein
VETGSLMAGSRLLPFILATWPFIMAPPFCTPKLREGVVSRRAAPKPCTAVAGRARPKLPDWLRAAQVPSAGIDAIGGLADALLGPTR